MHISIISPTTPVWGRVRIIGAINLIWSWNSAPIMGNLASMYIYYYYTQLTFTSENWTAQTHAIRRLNTKTHNMIYSTYCTCFHLNCRYYMTYQNPDIVFGDHWGINMKSCPRSDKYGVKSPIIPTYPCMEGSSMEECGGLCKMF